MPNTEPGPADFAVGTIIADRYRVEARLGRGGMGSVYRAHHIGLDRKVALKVLHPHLTEDPMVSKRFDREALAASKLDHVNCVQMLDAGTTADGVKYLVMQLLEGRELKDLHKGPVPHPRVVEIALQILAGLEHAHRRGLVHRDLKPENVFIVRDDEGRDVVKLVDFGIVKLLFSEGNEEKLTRAGLVFGTPHYMSPEQAAGGTIDERTDLYSVGVLMYEMLAGQPPFDADELGIVLRQHLVADPPPLPTTVPAGLRDVVMKLLAKSPKDRYATAKETREAIQTAMTAAPAKGGTVFALAPPSRTVARLPAVDVAPPAPKLAAPIVQPPVSAADRTVMAMPAPVFAPEVPVQPEPRRKSPALAIALVGGAAILVVATVLATKSCSSRAPTIERPPADPSAAAPTLAVPPRDTPDADPDAPPRTDEPEAPGDPPGRGKGKKKKKKHDDD